MSKAIKEASPERVEFEVGLQDCRIQEVANNNFNHIHREVWEVPPKKFRAPGPECSVYVYIEISGGDSQLYS